MALLRFLIRFRYIEVIVELGSEGIHVDCQQDLSPVRGRGKVRVDTEGCMWAFSGAAKHATRYALLCEGGFRRTLAGKLCGRLLRTRVDTGGKERTDGFVVRRRTQQRGWQEV